MNVNSALTNIFLKRSFIQHPEFSFGDPIIMYEHSRRVTNIALRIAQEVACDQELLEISALLHDIGKASGKDQETLYAHHAELGYETTKELLPVLDLTAEQMEALILFLKGESESVESHIIKDADIIAFYEDDTLQIALKKWGEENGRPQELERKARKFDQLHFPQSIQLAKSLHEDYVKKWNLQ